MTVRNWCIYGGENLPLSGPNMAFFVVFVFFFWDIPRGGEGRGGWINSERICGHLFCTDYVG